MNTSKSRALWANLILVLLAMGLAAGSTGLTLSTPGITTVPSPTPDAIVADSSATAAPQATASPSPSPSPSLTSTPQLVPTVTVSPSPVPTELPTPTPDVDTNHIIGRSVQGRAIVAHRIGDGPIKVALIGNIHGEPEANSHALAQQLLAHFESHPQEVPSNVSLWIVPTLNPDGLATGHRWNANDVDLNRNADTDLDGCAGNDWSPDTEGLEGAHPGAGGSYPFSEPEARAMRDFLADAWIAVFYHSAAEAIYLDTCQRHQPTARLAEALSTGSGYPVPESGWAGYSITGDFGDYLAGEGVASVTVELSDHEDPEFERNLGGVRALLANVDQIVSAETIEAGAAFTWLDDSNTGSWRFADDLFVHPLALEVIDDAAFLLDGGRVLALALDKPRTPQLLLAPGDDVEGTRVLEPLDLAADGTSLLVLDRAGDVYLYDPASRTWSMERYDRPSRDTYDHYFVALTAQEDSRHLLETTHEQVWQFTASSQASNGPNGAALVKLPQGRDVDLSSLGDDVYVLTRNMNGPAAQLLHYQGGRYLSAFEPGVALNHPRQVAATDTAIYVLDRAGRRLLALEPQSGTLLNLYQFMDRRAVSAIWADPSGKRLVLAGRDQLHFIDEPGQVATIEGGPVLQGLQPHDPALLESLRGLAMPIEGATMTSRDFQMPGAPRHYRLGVHEGMDFYGHTVGVPVNRQTPVKAVADGTVVRALIDYERLSQAEASAWASKSTSLGYTPPDVLDGYRGMQIWIEHENGIVSRYAHLGSITPGIAEGTKVTQGQTIGTVGNSGTPGSLTSETYDVHLHLELWIGDHYVGQFLRPIEARTWLEKSLR